MINTGVFLYNNITNTENFLILRLEMNSNVDQSGLVHVYLTEFLFILKEYIKTKEH